MLSRFRDYFGMSQREARGFLVLLILSACFLLSPFVTRFLFSDAKPDTTAADQKKLDSLLAKMETHEEGRSGYTRLDNEKTLADHYADPSRHAVNCRSLVYQNGWPNALISTVVKVAVFGKRRM